jgi:hypothetical protein
MEKKYLKEVNTLFVQLIEQEPCLYDTVCLEQAWILIQFLRNDITTSVKSVFSVKGLNPVPPPLVILLHPPNSPPDNLWINIRWHHVS